MVNNGRILTAQMAEDLAWMAEQDEVNHFVAERTYNVDAVASLRERQSAQRRAARNASAGTPLTDREADWLFRGAVITDIPA